MASSDEGAQVERIYIGGLNPPQLTVQELLRRLKDSLGSVIEILPSKQTPLDNETACYVHVNVQTKNPVDPKSAKDHVAKMYHNVTWKGCRLRVEEARPHFLERLQQERDDRKREEAHPEEEPEQPEPTACARRHLKIRERYGEQVFSVDTKPYDVDGWKGMNGLLKKIERRKRHFQEKLREEQGKTNNAVMQLNLRSQSKLNRAVHLKFVEERNRDSFAKEEGRTRQAVSDDDSQSTGDDSSTTDAYSTDSNLQNGKHPKSAYVWSSSDESGSDSSSTDGVEEGESKLKGQQQQQSSEDESSDEEGINQLASRGNEEQFSSENDESNSSDSTDKHNRNSQGKSKPPKRPSEFDELEDATDTQDKASSDDESSSSSDAYHAEPMEEATGSLLEDVESNLNVLASLFPDMKKAQPKKIAGYSEVPGEDEAAHTPNKSGWSAGGVMLRYDPRKDDAQTSKNEAQTKIDSASTSSEEEEENSKDTSDDNADNSVAEEETLKKVKGESEENENFRSASSEDDDEGGDAPKSNIYKQDKLEDVFREAREGVQETKQAVATPGAFAFEFNLGSDCKVDSNNQADLSGGFSFSFFPSTEDTYPESSLKAATDTHDAMDVDPAPGAPTTTTTDSKEPKPEAPKFRRKGLLFPKDVLDRYQEDFYVMNDNLKILQDLERYRHDEEVRAHWTHERQTLTKDWKRKRKHALQTRNQHHKRHKNVRHS